MERGLRAFSHDDVGLRVVEGRGGHDASTVAPGFIGDGERRYELVREISRGGMGTVHLGLLRGPLGFAKNVAIKTMHARDVADPQVAKIFAAEARLTAGLCHANIVSTLDVLVEAGSVFIVMEYIEGSSLADLVSIAAELGWLLPLEVSCAIMHDVLLGLEHAHDAGVIHCDISPQNILVGVDGLARVVDFGIAKVASSARHGTPEWDDNTEIRGKVPYMAPEQLRGGKMDHRVDLYAAGATLWELLTGRRLFRGANRSQIAENVLSANVDPPSRHLAEVPPELDAFVMRATQRDPRARFRSAREMADALASSVPLATRADVIMALRRLDTSANTPGSGIRALSQEEIEVRDHARALRATRKVGHPPAVIIDRGLLSPSGLDDGRRTTMSQVRKEDEKKKAKASLRVRLAIVGLLGIALGAGQATFNVLPIEPYVARVLPKKHAPTKVNAAKVAAHPVTPLAPVVAPPPTTPPVATPAPVIVEPASMPAPLPPTSKARAKTRR